MLAAHFLVPNGSFVGELIAFGVFPGLLILLPLVESASRRRWGWFMGILFLGPLAGIGWLLAGRRRLAAAG